ncbi:conserved hypothetical protein [Lebetimonas natsushimae]|uniref:Uncharacterized protein n=1 Tax=Lebetimonas natsushimae TaxID=1936991 RepID=A0A292YBX6_9BACT|nr:DUF2603 domain-containing protein [Lebetimonas natsushimae]GAX87268.1 conserved hypothetical protein [Lebetimonas natsushimae]
MVEKIKSLTPNPAIIECKEYELKEGDKNSSLWLIEIDGKPKVALDFEEYISLMESMKKLMKEVFELKLEKAILSEFPIDYDDVKAVVLEEMKKNPDMNLNDIVKKIKTEHPNLFYDINMDNIF